MVNVRFELTTNDPWSVDDAICEGSSPLGYWQKVNQSPTQTKPYNSSAWYPKLLLPYKRPFSRVINSSYPRHTAPARSV